ncbi:hypothetical protein [Pandoraea sp. CB10b_02]|uniref:hypothetical protein n=1 Tax=Pandoraea sp. CB10b_02 TaxID=2014535 RepID=UPI00257D7A22|nr:hypothetical protein [Pandoraea sp. CB10b_02]
MAGRDMRLGGTAAVLLAVSACAWAPPAWALDAGAQTSVAAPAAGSATTVPADTSATEASPATRQGWIDRLLAKLGAADKVDVSHGMDWGVMPGPFYNPEMGFGIGAAAVGLYKTRDALPTTQLSTMTIHGFGTTTGAFGIGVDNTTFFTDDRFRFVFAGALVNMPTQYWGIGYTRASNDDNREKYTKRSAFVRPTFLWRLWPSAYGGFGVDAHFDSAVNRDKGDASAFVTDPIGPYVRSIGVSANFSYDTRDFIPNPYRGQALVLTGTFYRRAFGSSTAFESLEWSYDHYTRFRERDVLAVDVYGKFSWGDVPWSMMPTFGDGKHMRGYFLGQYRDRNMLTAQVEYRLHLTGRHGMVVWLGAGAIADRPGNLASAHWLPNGGVGYRFEFKPRVNVRFDVGFGRQTRGVYFQINEAF